MCLIAFAWRAHPEYELIVAANRDEFHARPTQAAGWWPDKPQVLGGRDLQAGGTWLATTSSGRFAMVTNYREQSFTRGEHKSRGELVAEFVTGSQSPEAYARAVDGDDYAGFNLIAADRETMAYASNRGDSRTPVAPGIYGLSNASLDTPWSKVLRSKARLAELIETENVDEDSLLQLLHDRGTATEDVNSEHLPVDQARAITAPFIVTETYGTRCSTVLIRRSSGQTDLVERRFDSRGDATGVTRFSF